MALAKDVRNLRLEVDALRRLLEEEREERRHAIHLALQGPLRLAKLEAEVLEMRAKLVLLRTEFDIRR